MFIKGYFLSLALINQEFKMATPRERTHRNYQVLLPTLTCLISVQKVSYKL